MLYGAVPRDFSNGEDALHQDRTIPPLTGHPVILTEYDQHYPSRLARASAIAPAPGIHETRDYALDTLYLADDVGKVEPSVNFMLQPHDAHSPCTDASVQNGEPMWNMKTDREILFNLGTRGEARGYQGGQTLHDAHESLSPFSNCTPSSSQGLLAGAVPTPAYPPFVPDIVDGTTTNVRMIPLPPDRTVFHPGGGDTHERMDRICHASGKMALLSYSNGLRHQAVRRLPTIPYPPCNQLNTCCRIPATAHIGHVNYVCAVGIPCRLPENRRLFWPS
ncbi:hypothetical protein BKA82DRAFT_4157371 [Pisolithus tinctorius]|nr:hypothetical protein BKA82DRAFT_4157371 [Pisolithus tinctorius]